MLERMQHSRDTDLHPLIVPYNYTFREVSCHYIGETSNFQILSPKLETCYRKYEQC